MTVNSANFVQTSEQSTSIKSGEQNANSGLGSFSTILENTCSTIGFSRRADTVSSYFSELSDQAQAYLEKLKQRFGDTDFIIADFATEEQARELLKCGTGDYNCVLTPGLLEEMAADDEVGMTFEAIIETANTELGRIRETLSDCDDVTLGFAVTKDCVNFFASYVREGISYKINAEKVSDLEKQLSSSDDSLTEWREIFFRREYYEKMAVL